MKLHDIPQHWKDKIAADPDSEQAQKYLRVQRRIMAANGDHAAKIERQKQSSVGTWLAQKFKESIGAVPCGKCKRLMESLNAMPVDEISKNRDRIIKQIEANSKTATIKWWARVVSYADDTLTDGALTRCMVGRWLDEAIELEKASEYVPKNKDVSDEETPEKQLASLAGHSGSDTLDSLATG